LDNSPQQSAWKPWLAAILWTCVIATESSDIFSSSHTSRFLYPFLTWLFGPLNPVRYEFWHEIGRKAGHVIGYAILCFFFFRAWRASLPQGHLRWSMKWAALAWLFTAIVASLDEWHQNYIPSRTGSLRDVLLDCGAGLVMLILLYRWTRKRSAADTESAFAD
jgi:VanZ family protein